MIPNPGEESKVCPHSDVIIPPIYLQKEMRGGCVGWGGGGGCGGWGGGVVWCGCGGCFVGFALGGVCCGGRLRGVFVFLVEIGTRLTRLCLSCSPFLGRSTVRGEKVMIIAATNISKVDVCLRRKKKNPFLWQPPEEIIILGKRLGKNQPE